MSSTKSAQVESRRTYPGFDAVRIVAALGVVFSHSFLLADTNEDAEPFQALTGEILGTYGVYVFFILSGFLITESALNSSNIAQFVEKRARRLLPAFIVANVVMVAAIAPFFAPGGGYAFLSDPDTWRRLLNVLTFQDKRLWYEAIEFYEGTNAAGEWLSHSPNGVLWTIRLEVACYVVVGVLAAARILNANVSLILAVFGAIYAFQYHLQPGGWGGFGLLFPSFAAGMAMRLHLGDHSPNGRIAFCSFAGLVASMFFLPGWQQIAPVLFPLFASYPLLWIGFYGPQLRRSGLQHTDPSYGIYMWGWPVQQLLLSFLIYLGFAEISGALFALIAMPVAYVAGVASWHLIEKPFLYRKKARSRA